MSNTPDKKEEGALSPAETIVKGLNGLGDRLEKLEQKTESELADLKKSVDTAKTVDKSVLPFNIRKGENVMSSRPYMISHLCRRMRIAKGKEHGDAREVGKQEAAISERLHKHYCGGAQWSNFSPNGYSIPLGASMLPMNEITNDEGESIPAVPAELRKEISDSMRLDGSVDLDELRALGLPLRKGLVNVMKDMSADNSTTGGAFVAEAAQGELIEILRASEIFSQVGARQLDFPPMGKFTFPRVTSSVTVAATSEGATISESTPGTNRLNLVAKPYSALTDVPEELFMFATPNTEAWLRAEMMAEHVLKTDRDMINGAGGIAIQGIINFSGVGTRTASTVATNGDTLDPEDPILHIGDITDQNSPVDNGTTFHAMTGSLFAGLTTRRNSSVFVWTNTANALNGKNLNGTKVVTSTQVPTDRTKGSGTTLTLLLTGVGSEWVIARAGVMQVDMTDSDASKFQQRLSTVRSTQYIDAGPRHVESFSYIDDLLNS